MSSLEKLKCIPCKQIAELPCVSKFNLPQIAAPNLTVTLDVMTHFIHSTSVEFLDIMDAGDLLIKLAHLPDATAQTAFRSFLYR